MNSISYEELKVGQKASFEKTISESDVYSFAGIVGDLNSFHVNEEKAKKTVFKTRICHGMLVGSFISTVLGMFLPGTGTIYLSQSLEFKKPVKIGETITAEVEVLEKLKKNKVKLKTIVKNSKNTNVVEGEAVVIAPKSDREGQN